MAKITKSDSAPKEQSHYTLGAVSFDLTDASSVFETNDPTVIADAQNSPFLDVKVDAPAATAAVADYDPSDPHDNPAADHLGELASQEAIDAAAANQAAIAKAAGVAVQAPSSDNPTVAETVQATVAVIAPSATAEVAKPPAPGEEPAPAPVADSPTPPAAPVATPTAAPAGAAS